MANTVNLTFPSTGLTISEWVNELTVINCTSARTATIDCDLSNTFVVNLYESSSSHTFTLTHLKVGQTVKITIVQPAAHTSTVTWGGTGNQTIRWTGGTDPTSAGLSTTYGNADTIVLYGAGSTTPPYASMIGGTLALANF